MAKNGPIQIDGHTFYPFPIPEAPKPPEKPPEKKPPEKPAGPPPTLVLLILAVSILGAMLLLIAGMALSGAQPPLLVAFLIVLAMLLTHCVWSVTSMRH